MPRGLSAAQSRLPIGWRMRSCRVLTKAGACALKEVVEQLVALSGATTMVEGIGTKTLFSNQRV